MEIYKIYTPISTTPYGKFQSYYTSQLDLDNQLDQNYEKIKIDFLNISVTLKVGLNLFSNDFKLYSFFKYNGEDIFITDDLIEYFLNRMDKNRIFIQDDEELKKYKPTLPKTKDFLLSTYNIDLN